MKPTTFTTILLTLIMLLLVAAAALFFLLPRQNMLLQRNDALLTESDQLQQELAQSGLALASTEATREAGADALATSEANGLILAGELVQSDQETADLQTERDGLTAQLDEATAAMTELQIENQQVKGQFPFVSIVSPDDDEVFPPDETIDLLIVVYDPVGITAVNLTLDDDTESYEGNDEPYFIHRQKWSPAEEGEHAISVMVVNTEGKASAPIAVTIQLIDIDALNSSIRSKLEANVIELTGLELLEPIEPTLLTRDELSVRIEADFSEEITPEISRRDTLVLSAFDFLEPEYDLFSSLVDLYSEGVLGFYDPDNSEFVIVSDDAILDVEEQLTHVHEFVHALQDQHYGLNLLSDDDLDSEAAAAMRALTEGHATLVQSLYLANGYMSSEEIAEILAGYEEEDTSFLDSTPAILAADLAFPYTMGLDFVMNLYQEDGFEAIEDAWDNLPQSTEQILHFDRYKAGDVPQIVTLPPLTGTLGVSWHLLEEGTFGEFFLRQYLGQQLEEQGVEMAATGWGGDRYAVYENETDASLVMALRLAWDSAVDREEFTAIFPQYPAYLFETSDEIQQDDLVCWSGVNDVICLTEIGNDSLIVRTPNVATAVLVADAFQ